MVGAAGGPSTLAEPLKVQAVRSIGDSRRPDAGRTSGKRVHRGGESGLMEAHSTLLVTSAGLIGLLAVLVFLMLGSYRTDR